MRALPKFLTAKRVTVGVVAVAVLVGITGALRPDPVEVEAAVASRGALRVTVDVEGKTRVRDRYVVAAPVSGRLERVPLAEGMTVRAGDVIARIAPAPVDEPSARQARARLDAARAHAVDAAARVRAAEAALGQARRDAERTRRLATAGALAEQSVEEAELLARARAEDLAGARALASAAAAEVQQTKAALLYSGGRLATGGVVVVRAPTAGRVLRLAERSERVIAPGSLIAEVGDTRGIEVVVDVLSSDAARVRPGMPVVLDGWGGDAPVAGRVRLIEPAATTRVSALGIEEQRVNVLVDIPAAPAALGDGYHVDAHIVVWERPSVLTVPASALVRAPQGWAVYAIDAGRARLRPVAIGQLGGAAAEVLGGLAVGQRVILFPSDAIREGVRVR